MGGPWPVPKVDSGGRRAYGLLEVLCATHTAEELFHLGQGLGLTWGAVRRPEEWLDDPQAAARGFPAAVEHPELGRSLLYPGAPFSAPASPMQIRRRAPLVGEDTAAVLGDLGLSAEELERLRMTGIVGGEWGVANGEWGVGWCRGRDGLFVVLCSFFDQVQICGLF